MKLYCGIDLHSNNNVPVIIDENDKVLFNKRLSNDLNTVLSYLKPFRQELVSVAVESTFNWYWLVDGLQEAGYDVTLVHTPKVQSYSGLKRTDDESDAFWLAHLMRLELLPSAYIYPKEARAVRDLLRKRAQLVRCQTQQILSIENQYTRNTGMRITSNNIKQQTDYLADITNPNTRLAIESNQLVFKVLHQQIATIEAAVVKQVRLRPEFKLLLTVSGIGKILALTIMLETGSIARFNKVGNYASYSRCVDSAKFSNSKKKGAGNKRNGNKYLAWAFIEAANFAKRYNDKALRFYQRKAAKTNGIIAIKALAHKLARACYYILKDQQPFDETKLFS